MNRIVRPMPPTPRVMSDRVVITSRRMTKAKLREHKYHKHDLHEVSKAFPRMLATPCGFCFTDPHGKLIALSIPDHMARELEMLPCMRCYQGENE